MVNKQSFKNVFPRSFKDKLKESIVPFEKTIMHDDIINELHEEIIDNVYHPSKPREYIIANKHNYVARIIPTFQAHDYYVYYFCLKMLEQEIAINRVEGTYGGWTLGNAIRLRENDDTYLINEYAPNNSFNPKSWMQNWQDFQKKAYQYAKQDDYAYYIKFDISNFYNSINLDLLIRKIYLSIPLLKRFYGELLSHFLYNWNKKLEGYVDKKVGIPQDEIGDCSRILANFFLQDYDRNMKCLCDQNNSKYLRYADDQIIFCKNKNQARHILFEASKFLFKNDLILNSSKVIEFGSEAEFNEYWAFELFDLLSDKDNKKFINIAVEQYIKKRESGEVFRDNSVLKRIVSVNFYLLKPECRFKILSELLNKEFLSNLDWWWYKKIYEKMVTGIERAEYCNLLDEMIDEIHFNSYHYNIKMFYKKIKIKYDEDKINSAIKRFSF
jgi:hypothetical protein